MNVLQVRPFLEQGGASRYILALSAGLARRGHRVWIACQGGEALEQAKASANLRQVQPLSPSSLANLAASAAQLTRIVRREKIDVIHSHHRFAALACRWASLWTGVPLVSTVHEIKEDRWLLGAVGLGEQVIALSQAVKDFLIWQYRVRPERITRIPMGVDVPQPLSSEQLSAVKRRLDISAGRPVIGCVGRLSPEKGQVYLLGAASEILRTCPEAIFLIVGDGPDRASLERCVRDQGLCEQVRFLGWMEDAAQIIAAMDLLVVPSLTEGFGLAALEAMAWKKSVVASGVGGLVDVVRPGQTGLLVPPRNSYEIASAVVRLLADRGYAGALGENGLRLVKEGYSMQKMIEQTEDVYRRSVG